MTRGRRRSYGVRDASAYGGKAPRDDVWTSEANTTRPPGLIAWYDGECDVCDQPVQKLVSRVAMRKGVWVHTHCVAGSRDGEDL